MTNQERIDQLLDEAVALGLEEVERLARGIMKRNPRAKSFTMCMGCWFFTDRNGDIINDDPAYLQPMWDFMRNDRYLKLTGNPMKIKGHDGPLENDW